MAKNKRWLTLAAALIIGAAVAMALFLAAREPVGEAEARYLWALHDEMPLARDSLGNTARAALISLGDATERALYTHSLLYPPLLDVWSQAVGESVLGLRALSVVFWALGLLTIYVTQRRTVDARLTLVTVGGVALVTLFSTSPRSVTPFALAFWLTTLTLAALTVYTQMPRRWPFMLPPLVALAVTSDAFVVVVVILLGVWLYNALRLRQTRGALLGVTLVALVIYVGWWFMRLPLDDGLNDNMRFLLPIGSAALAFFTLPRRSLYEISVGLLLVLYITATRPTPDWSWALAQLHAQRDPREAALLTFAPHTLAAHLDRELSFSAGVSLDLAWMRLSDDELRARITQAIAVDAESVWLMGYADQMLTQRVRLVLSALGYTPNESYTMQNMEFARWSRQS